MLVIDHGVFLRFAQTQEVSVKTPERNGPRSITKETRTTSP